MMAEQIQGRVKMFFEEDLLLDEPRAAAAQARASRLLRARRPSSSFNVGSVCWPSLELQQQRHDPADPARSFQIAPPGSIVFSVEFEYSPSRRQIVLIQRSPDRLRLRRDSVRFLLLRRSPSASKEASGDVKERCQRFGAPSLHTSN